MEWQMFGDVLQPILCHLLCKTLQLLIALQSKLRLIREHNFAWISPVYVSTNTMLMIPLRVGRIDEQKVRVHGHALHSCVVLSTRRYCFTKGRYNNKCGGHSSVLLPTPLYRYSAWVFFWTTGRTLLDSCFTV